MLVKIFVIIFHHQKKKKKVNRQMVNNARMQIANDKIYSHGSRRKKCL